MRMLMVFACVAVVLAAPATRLEACEVDLVSVDSATWYLYSDVCVGSTELIWEPQVRPDKRRPEEALLSTPINVCRCASVVWRLETGDMDAFDWAAVRDRLMTDHGVIIGELHNCTVCGVVGPTECYSTQVDVYPAYERRVYRVAAGSATAIVSVLAPRDGMALVYNGASVLDYHACVGAVGPQSALGTCASTSARPEVGACLDGGTNKVRPRDDPVLDQPRGDFRTWGAVKAVYTDE